MTRFVYIADTHPGTDALGYHQQPAYPSRLPQLLALLDRWVLEQEDIAFLLHGGDMVDHCTHESIRGAGRAFHMSVPTCLCLGNHDVTSADALTLWLDVAPGFFPQASPMYTVAMADCRLHVGPNHWEERPYFWDQVQEPRFSAEQLEWLETALTHDTALPHILCTHSPALGAPPEQTGFDAPFHPPPESLSHVLLDLAQRHPHLRLVLSGHSHINMHVRRGNAHFATVSGFSETPFEFKVVEVNENALRMSTHALDGLVGFAPEYDPSHAFVQGRPEDRGFEEVW